MEKNALGQIRLIRLDDVHLDQVKAISDGNEIQAPACLLLSLSCFLFYNRQTITVVSRSRQAKNGPTLLKNSPTFPPIVHTVVNKITIPSIQGVYKLCQARQRKRNCIVMKIPSGEDYRTDHEYI